MSESVASICGEKTFTNYGGCEEKKKEEACFYEYVVGAYRDPVSVRPGSLGV